MKVIKILILLAFIFTSNFVFAEATNDTEDDNNNTNTGIVGKYKCQRSDADSNNTVYPLSITKTGETYTLEWTDNEGNPVMYGTGIIHSDMTNVLTSSYWNIANTDIGIESFSVTPDGDLKGNWLAQSGKSSGTENCNKS